MNYGKILCLKMIQMNSKINYKIMKNSHNITYKDSLKAVFISVHFVFLYNLIINLY